MPLRVIGLCVLLGLLFASGGANAQGAVGQGILGAWTLVSVEGVRDDGTKSEPFGPKPKGIIIFSPGGYFSLFQSRADVPKIAANDREKATPEEAKAVIAGAIAYYGTYSVNEADTALSVRLQASTYANLVGGEQKRVITSLTTDELKFTNPRTPAGLTLHDLLCAIAFAFRRDHVAKSVDGSICGGCWIPCRDNAGLSGIRSVRRARGRY
jgi:hypothetical protein